VAAEATFGFEQSLRRLRAGAGRKERRDKGGGQRGYSSTMAHVLILYATVEGQTACIAARIAERLEARGHAVDVREAGADNDPAAYDAVIVGASVHYGHHPAWLRAVLRRHGEALERRPSAFFSVSLSAQEGYATRFLRQARWRPDAVAVFAGALKYTRYRWFKRLLVRAFAWMGGHATDTSRDHEYTDWGSVAHFAEAFAQRLAARA